MAEKITYGSDPEATLYKDGRMVPAQSSEFRSLSAKIGADGAGTPVEFRPSPTENPEDLVKELTKLFKRVYSKGFDLSIHGNDTALGCHIHIGGEYVVQNRVAIARALDEWIGQPFKTKNGRRRGNYSFLER